MIRTAILLLCLTCTLPAAAEDQLGQGPALKSEATVSSDIVRIGDLVENAGVVADVPIFRAPDLGQSGAVSATRVIEAVRAHHIIGLDTRGLAEVMVTRSSRTIGAKDIESRIVHALAGQYGLADAKNLAVTFDSEPRTVQVAQRSGELSVTRLTFESRTGRFDASLELPGGTTTRRTVLRFTGSVQETFETAVPVRVLAQGEILKISDFMITRRPKAEFAPGTVTDAEQAVGFAARRTLQAGRAFRQNDLQKPEIVARNENVTITYEAPGIMLTMRGQALEGGTQGDLISISNVHSKKVIRATVVGPGRVIVYATPPRLAANNTPPSSRNSARAE